MNEFSRFVKQHDLKITDGYSICQNKSGKAASLPVLLLLWESAETCYQPCWGGKFTSHCWEREISLEPTCIFTPPHHPSATVPGHICRALPSSGPFIPLLAESLFWVSRLPCPMYFGSETFCFFKALQQQRLDNLLVLSQVYIKAQQWSNITYSGCGTDFSFQRCGWFAVFPKHM